MKHWFDILDNLVHATDQWLVRLVPDNKVRKRYVCKQKLVFSFPNMDTLYLPYSSYDSEE